MDVKTGLLWLEGSCRFVPVSSLVVLFDLGMLNSGVSILGLKAYESRAELVFYSGKPIIMVIGMYQRQIYKNLESNRIFDELETCLKHKFSSSCLRSIQSRLMLFLFEKDKFLESDFSNLLGSELES